METVVNTYFVKQKFSAKYTQKEMLTEYDFKTGAQSEASQPDC